MIVPRDVDPRRPAIRPCVERIEQDIDPRPVEFLNEGSGRVIDDCAALPLPNPVEHFYDDVGLAGAGSTAEQDVLRLEGVGDVDPADLETTLGMTPQRPAPLPPSSEPGAAQELVGAEAPARPGARKSVGEGKSVAVRVDIGGGRYM